MPTLNVGGQSVQVGDDFLGLTPDQQHAAVDHIANSLSITAKSQPESYTGSILPISRDAQGNYSPAVPGMLRGLYDSAVGAATAPGDVYMGRAATPYSAPLPPLAPGSVSEQPDPALLKRAADFAMLFSPVNPAVRAGDMAIPGEATASMQPEKAVVPTAQELKAAGGAGYDAARATGLEVTGSSATDLADRLRSGLNAKGIIAPRAPDTHALIDQLVSPREPGATSTVSLDGLLAARESFADVAKDFNAKGPDRLGATRAIQGIDHFLETLSPQNVVAGTASPEEVAGMLKNARGNWAAAQRSNNLTGELDRAVTGVTERAANRAQAANSGFNLDNTIRQKVASFLEKPKEISGYSDEELDALRQVLNGGPVRNAARQIGNRLGGGGGVGQSLIAALGASAGGAGGGLPGALIGGVAPVAVGTGARSLANALATRSLGKADEIVRMNSPLYRDALTSQPFLNPSIDRNTAILRALGLGGSGLYGQPQPRGLFGGWT